MILRRVVSSQAGCDSVKGISYNSLTFTIDRAQLKTGVYNTCRGSCFMITSSLIHPPRLTSTILFFGILRRDVVAVLVEGDFAIVFAHVDFEFAGCPGSLPTV